MLPWFGLNRLLFTLLRLLVTLLTRGATVLPRDPGELELDDATPVIYVLRDASLIDLAVLDRQTERLNLPSPTDARTVGTAQLGRSHFPLYRRQWFSGRQRAAVRPRELERLVEALRANEHKDVELVPVSLFWGRRPDTQDSLWRIMFSDNWSAPGAIRKFFITLTQGRQLYIQLSAPVSLRRLVDECDSAERAERKTLRLLRVHFRRQREAAIGPDLSHRRTLVNTIMRSEAVQDEIRQTARREKQKSTRVRKRARRYAMEIMADYSHTVIRFLEVLFDWVWNRLYDGIRTYNISRLHEVARDHEIVYVPCHRSHADYLLLSYVVYKNGLVPPHIAAGINLNLPVLGPILRRGGAFFMRRSFRDDRLYSTVFHEYMHIMLSRGFSIEYFVEGGRSRSGRMLKPRTGMLAMTVRSYLRNAEKPIAFVPVYIGYEKLMEGNSYIGEMHGRKKQKETVGGFLKSLSVLRQHFGQVHVSFGEPLRLTGFLDHQAPGWRKEVLGENEKPDWFVRTVNALGTEVVTRINAAAAANPVNLLSLALLGTPRQTMDEQQLERQLQLYITLLQQAPYSHATSVSSDSAREIIDYGLTHGFISRVEHMLGHLITTDAGTALQMTYIRNNALHLFVLPGLVSSLFLNARSQPVERLRRLVRLLYPFFRTEYFLHWQEESELDAALEQAVTVLLQQGLLREDDERPGYLRGAALHTMEAELLDQLGQTVLPALERFYLTIRILVQHGSGVLTDAELEELARSSAQRLSLLYEFNSPEFFDRAVLRNFIQELRYHALVWRKDDELLYFDERLESLDDEARRVLAPEIRLAIQRLTRLDTAA